MLAGFFQWKKLLFLCLLTVPLQATSVRRLWERELQGVEFTLPLSGATGQAGNGHVVSVFCSVCSVLWRSFTLFWRLFILSAHGFAPLPPFPLPPLAISAGWLWNFFLHTAT